MEKEAIAVWATDLHISEKTLSVTEGILEQLLETSIEHNNATIILGGDIFTSRKGQSDPVLRVFRSFLKKAQQKEVSVVAIPGNHDKTDYFSEHSFLDFFDGEDVFDLITTTGGLVKGDVTFHLIPYFDETIYLDYLKRIKPTRSKFNYLMTHIAINGVMNNDGSEVKDAVPASAFSDFDQVFVGHYHDAQTFKNIIYTGSTHQANFGEDFNKGCFLFYADGTFEQQPLQYPTYTTHKIDIEGSVDDASRAISKIKQLAGRHRIVIEEDGLTDTSAIRQKFEAEGIKVVVRYKDAVADPESVDIDISQPITDDELREDYEDWVIKKKPANPEEGRELLFPSFFYYHHDVSGSVWKSKLPPDEEFNDGNVDPVSRETAERLAKEYGVELKEMEKSDASSI